MTTINNFQKQYIQSLKSIIHNLSFRLDNLDQKLLNNAVVIVGLPILKRTIKKYVL